MGGPLPLNYTDIANYCVLADFNKEERKELLHYLKLLDRLWVESYYEKNAPATKAPDGKTNKKK